jgi:hypothetical protein
MLVPAAILVLVILGSIAADSALAFLGQRELENFAATAATSAASAGLDPAAFYNDQHVAIDPQRANDIVQTLQEQIGTNVHDVRVVVVVDGADIKVTATGTVNDLFAPAIPGVHHSWRVHASARATARQLALP